MRAKLKIALITCLFWILSTPAWSQWDLIFKDSTTGMFDVAFLNQDTGFVIGVKLNSSRSFVYKTQDAGLSWDTIYFLNEAFREIDFPNQDTGYIVLGNPSTVSVRRTIDGGQSWQMVASNILVGNSQLQIDFYNGMQGVISMPGWSFITSDAGVTWTQITTNINGGEPNMIVKDSVYLGVGGNFMISSYDSCQNFSVLQNLYNQATPVYTQASGNSVDLENGNIVIGALGQNGFDFGYPHLNYGVIALGSLADTNFTTMHLKDIYMIREVEMVGSVIYAVCDPLGAGNLPDGFIIKSSDGGQTWFTQQINEPGGFSYGAMERIFCVNDTVCYTIAGGNIYKTTNGGGPPVNAVNTMVVGLEEYNSNTSSVILYPNPNNGSFTLTGLENIKYVEIVDLSGKLVKRITVNNKQANINLETIETGIYFATVYTVTYKSSIKFIKQ